MTSPPIVFDGLWRCLCPSLGSTASIISRTTRIRVPNGSKSLQAALPCRKQSGLATNFTPNVPSLQKLGPRRTPRPRRHEADSLVHLSTSELYERMRHDGAAGRYHDCFDIVKILLKDRRERPNILIYSAYLHSFASSEYGTAGKIRKVLDEMWEAGVEPDAQACHNILEGLAVHPDYLLREEILQYMKERWFTLTERGHNMVAAGLLRDRLFEQALDKIEEMVQKQIRVAPWLYDKAIYFLLDYGEIEEAYQLLRMREELGEIGEKAISYTLWMRCLDSASRAHHAEATKHIWNSQVVPSYLKPSTGTCLNVLNVAARTGNVKLATDVFRVLVEREAVFDIHHYEMLLEAYLNAKDLEAALSVIMIMHDSGLNVEEAGLHRLYSFLSQEASHPMEAFDILQNLERSGREVPTAAVNVCLQASVYLERLEEAVEMYKALHTVSRAGPTTTTFNILFQGCHKAARKELAMFLASEMIQLGLKPDSLTYDRLVHVCCQAEDINDAFLYYEEMRNSGLVGRRGMFEMLIDHGLEAGDARTPGVLNDMKDAGFKPKKIMDQAVRARFAEVHKAAAPVAEAASLLRQIVAGPRARHPEAGLDLCYVTDNIIATSGPSGTYPQRAYRNPLDVLVKFLDQKHGEDWAIWEFRAEGTGYPDSEVYNRIYHYPFPDHHPPPFALIPNIMASMRNWLKEKDGRVVVVHCKAGKGRSGTASCSYLISEEGWKVEDALKRFTERRMKPNWGAGVSIPSQLRWIGYVDRWAKHGKIYVERQIEVLELHCWGLRDGVKIEVEGFTNEGKIIKSFHKFKRDEREIVRGEIQANEGFAQMVSEVMGRSGLGRSKSKKDKEHTVVGGEKNNKSLEQVETNPQNSSQDLDGANASKDKVKESGRGDVVYRPSNRVVLPTNDINIDVERRNKAAFDLTMVTSVAHVWFNTFFEGNGPEQNGHADESGVFEITWEAMDGIKGSSRKGTQGFDKIAVVWKALKDESGKSGVLITEPGEGQEVKQASPADWQGQENVAPNESKDLGLRTASPIDSSTNLSRASSIKSHKSIVKAPGPHEDSLDGVRSHGPDGEEAIGVETDPAHVSGNGPSASPTAAHTEASLANAQLDGTIGSNSGQGSAHAAGDGVPQVGDIQHPVSTGDLPDGTPENELKNAKEHVLGHLGKHKRLD